MVEDMAVEVEEEEDCGHAVLPVRLPLLYPKSSTLTRGVVASLYDHDSMSGHWTPLGLWLCRQQAFPLHVVWTVDRSKHRVQEREGVCVHIYASGVINSLGSSDDVDLLNCKRTETTTPIHAKYVFKWWFLLLLLLLFYFINFRAEIRHALRGEKFKKTPIPFPFAC